MIEVVEPPTTSPQSPPTPEPLEAKPDAAEQAVRQAAESSLPPQPAPDTAPMPAPAVYRREITDSAPPEIEPPPRERSPTAKPTPSVTVLAANPNVQFAGQSETTVDLSQNAPPDYPEQAVRARLEGLVVLELSVSSEGQVEAVRVLRSSGHALLDRAAVNAVSSWSGKPATRFGVAVESVERLPIRFRL
jgi:protein TonB